MVLHCPGHGKGAYAGIYRPCACVGILAVGCRRYGDLAGNRGKCPGKVVVGVIIRGVPGRPVEGYGDGSQDRVESVGDGYIVRSRGGSISQVLDDESVGDLPVLCNSGGGQGFADGQQGSVIRLDRVGHQDVVGDSCAGDGGGVGDGTGGVQRCKLVHIGLVDQYSVAVCGDGESAEGQGRSCRHRGSGLQCTVCVIARGTGHVGQGIPGVFICCDSTQIIRDGKACESRCAGVYDADDIGYVIIGSVGVTQSCLCGGQNLQKFTGGDVGGGGVPIIG